MSDYVLEEVTHPDNLKMLLSVDGLEAPKLSREQWLRIINNEGLSLDEMLVSPEEEIRLLGSHIVSLYRSSFN